MRTIIMLVAILDMMDSIFICFSLLGNGSSPFSRLFKPTEIVPLRGSLIALLSQSEQAIWLTGPTRQWFN